MTGKQEDERRAGESPRSMSSRSSQLPMPVSALRKAAVLPYRPPAGVSALVDVPLPSGRREERLITVPGLRRETAEQEAAKQRTVARQAVRDCLCP